jgi:hypothetical protein
MFSYVTLEQRVPLDHPLRAIRKLTDTVLRSLSGEFDKLYSASGRPSIAPEYVLRALLTGPQPTSHPKHVVAAGTHTDVSMRDSVVR